MNKYTVTYYARTEHTTPMNQGAQVLEYKIFTGVVVTVWASSTQQALELAGEVTAVKELTVQKIVVEVEKG